MTKGIFEGAKFGDKFVTRGEKIVIYLMKDKLYSNNSHLIVNDCDSLPYKVDDTGKVANIKSEHWLDIVSRYQKHIDEEELDKLAIEARRKTSLQDYPEQLAFECGFIAGYSKAMEE